MRDDEFAPAVIAERGWTEERRAHFLAVLGDTCNVRAAVAAVGMASSGLYYLRRRDSAFAADWRDALAIGYDRLEQALLRHALVALGELPPDEAVTVDGGGDGADGAPGEVRPGTGFSPAAGAGDIQLGMLLLNLHRGGVEGRGGTRRAKRATTEQTDASLRKKLDALALRLRAQA